MQPVRVWRPGSPRSPALGRAACPGRCPEGLPVQDFQSSMSAAAGRSRCRPGLRQGWAMAYWSGSIQPCLEWTEELDSLGPENAGSVDTGGRRERHHAAQCAGRSSEKNAWSRVLPTAWRPLTRATQGRRGGRAPRQGWSQCCCPAAESQGPVVQEAGAHSGRQPHRLWEAPAEHQGGEAPGSQAQKLSCPG